MPYLSGQAARRPAAHSMPPMLGCPASSARGSSAASPASNSPRRPGCLYSACIRSVTGGVEGRKFLSSANGQCHEDVTSHSKLTGQTPYGRVRTAVGLCGLKPQVRQRVPAPSVGIPWTAVDAGVIAADAAAPATLLVLRYRWLRAEPLPSPRPGAVRRLPPLGSAARGAMIALGTAERVMFSLLVWWNAAGRWSVAASRATTGSTPRPSSSTPRPWRSPTSPFDELNGLDR
jgi:hypothetical protein